MDWNIIGPPQGANYNEQKNYFDYTCMGGSSVIPELKEACAKAEIKAVIKWNMEPAERTESYGAEEHCYIIDVRSNLDVWYTSGWFRKNLYKKWYEERGERLGGKLGITQ